MTSYRDVLSSICKSFEIGRAKKRKPSKKMHFRPIKKQKDSIQDGASVNRKLRFFTEMAHKRRQFSFVKYFVRAVFFLSFSSPSHYGTEQPKIQTNVLGHSLVDSLVRLHRSLFRLLHPACFARALRCAHSLTCSLRSLPRLWDSERLERFLCFSLFCTMHPFALRSLRPEASQIHEETQDERTVKG